VREARCADIFSRVCHTRLFLKYLSSINVWQIFLENVVYCVLIWHIRNVISEYNANRAVKFYVFHLAVSLALRYFHRSFQPTLELSSLCWPLRDTYFVVWAAMRDSHKSSVSYVLWVHPLSSPPVFTAVVIICPILKHWINVAPHEKNFLIAW